MRKKLRICAAAVLALLLGALQICSAGASAEPVFQDVDPATEEGKAILALTEAGYISPAAPGVFSPDTPIEAATYVEMLGRMRGLSPTSSAEDEAAGYIEAALQAGWFDWDEIPPDNSAGFSAPISRELGANILVRAFFGPSVSYNYTEESAKISDFSSVGGRYYLGVLGGLSKGLFDHQPGTPFCPRADLSRGSACLWAWNALYQAADPLPGPSSAVPPSPTASVPSLPLDTPVTVSSGQAAVRGGVSENGWLQVKGTQLCSETGEPVVLHGMSSHGIQWFPQYTNRQSIENTRSEGANIFRVAMYVEEGGYMQNPALMKQRVTEAVAHAVSLDMYVIIDWHILQDGNPLTHADAAAAFFEEMSARYADVPNVIYEICNEPNGNITWSGDARPYAQRMVSVIRAHSPRGIILIGSPTWDQDVDQAAQDPVSGSNLMYTLHFYAGTHHQDLRDKADRALSLGAPLFVSEWGTSAADGSGGVFLNSSDEWMAWMQEKNISWCNWSLCDKNESSAALLPGTSADIVWTEANLSESGKYVFARFADAADSSGSRTSVTAEDALKALSVQNAGFTIEKDGRRLTAEDIISTGCELVTPDHIRYTVIVCGDVTGSGQISIVQLVMMARVLNGTASLAGPYLTAACLVGGYGVSIADLVREAGFLTGRYPMQIILQS